MTGNRFDFGDHKVFGVFEDPNAAMTAIKSKKWMRWTVTECNIQ